MRVLAASLFLAATAFPPFAAPAAKPAGVTIHRTWMPDAHPSSFAVGFPSGLSFCFDPVRGNVVYAWTGPYADLTPTLSGKFPRNAEINGEIFYRSSETTPFRAAGQAGPPTIRFKGYRIRNGLPQFEYEVDGAPVLESIRPASDGGGLIRQFQITTPGRTFVFRAAAAAQVSIQSGPAAWVEGELTIPENTRAVLLQPLPLP